MVQEIGVEFRNLWKRNRVALGLRHTGFIGVDIIRRKPLPFFRFDSGHQFLAGHIIHFPLPSADPSVLSTTNGAGPLVGGTDGYIIIEHAFCCNTYWSSGSNLKLCSVYYRCVAQSSKIMRRQYDYEKGREAHAPRPHAKRSQLMFCRLHSSCDASDISLTRSLEFIFFSVPSTGRKYPNRASG